MRAEAPATGRAAQPGETVRFLLRYVRRRSGLALGVVGAVTSGALCAVAAQYGLKLLVDAMTAPAALAERRVSEVYVRLGLFLALLGLESACWRVGGWLGSRAIIRFGEDIRLDLFESVAARSWSFFNGQASGALSGRITAAAQAATTVLRTTVWNLVPPVTDLAGSIVVLAAIDWRVAVGLVAVAGLATWGLNRLGLRGFPLHRTYHREAAEVAGNLTDVLANIGLVRAYGALGRERERLRERMAAEGHAHARSWMFLEVLRCGHDGAFWLAIAAVLIVSVREWSQGAITTGGVVVASTLTLRILNGSRESALSLLGLAQQFGAVSEAIEVLHAPPGPTPPAITGTTLRPRAGAIELRAICYAPDRGRPALFEGLDLSIPAGQRVGIVGRSGAGKSTLLRLVQGLAVPQSGTVLLDGQALAGAEPDSLAAAFAVVTQEVPLLHRSVVENLRLGRPDVPWEEMLDVARETGCDAFVRALPQCYETIVGERGMRLSGGQRQRLAIARALLRPAPVLLLDEATSALDSHGELEVQRALLSLAGGRTVLAVAHRLSTVVDFDRVVVLHEGRIVEDGPPRELLRRGQGHFARVWRLQQGAAVDVGSAA